MSTATAGGVRTGIGADGPETGPLLAVRHLVVAIRTHGDALFPVSDFSLTVDAGQRVALVGESGSGKSLSALAIMRLLPRVAHIDSGEILLNGRDLLRLTARDMAAIRGRQIAMVSQNPMSALNPLMTIGRQLVEALHQDINGRRSALRRHAVALLEEVGLPRPAERLDDYPHQLSGGMRQRVAIAIALSRNPALIIADEPTTALDVVTQDRVVSLLTRAAAERGMAVLFITHDLAIASRICTDVQVMYAGREVERASATSFFSRPVHPYSEALLRSVCRIGQPVEMPLPVPPGSPPVLGAIPRGCPYHPRCSYAQGVCAEAAPPSVRIDEGNAFATCHFAMQRLVALTTNGAR